MTLNVEKTEVSPDLLLVLLEILTWNGAAMCQANVPKDK